MENNIKKTKIGIIGMSGFGAAHLRVAKSLEEKGILELCAVCDNNYDKCKETIDSLAENNVRYYKDYTAMLKSEKELDFISIATPHYLHKKMSIDAMEAGFNVLLEKPPALRIQDVRDIIAASERTNRLCGIDFMNTSIESFRKLLSIVSEGKLGRIKTVSAAGLFLRTSKYYERTPWAGKMIHNGYLVLDGTINNPLSHMLNNLIFIAYHAGCKDQCCIPEVEAVTAEIYHGHEIEGEDTSCVKVEMSNGTELFFYATLCYLDTRTYFVVEGTKGKAYWNYKDTLRVEYDGQAEEYNHEVVDNVETIFANMSAVIQGTEKELYCPVSRTLNFIKASNGAYESFGQPQGIPSEYLEITQKEDEVITYIKDIEKTIDEALIQKKLFSQLAVPWAVQGKRKDMRKYGDFNMFKGN